MSEDLNGTYIFSAKDLNLMSLLPELVDAVLADPCCKDNPMEVEGFVVRRILEEVSGRV